MKVKASPSSVPVTEIHFSNPGGKYRCSKFLLPLGNLAETVTMSLFPHSLGVLWLMHMACLKSSLRSPYAFGGQASGAYDDSGRSWCFPDGFRSGHAITALQLGNVMLGWWSGCWEGGIWLWIGSVLYLNAKIEQIYTYIHVKSISTHIRTYM